MINQSLVSNDGLIKENSRHSQSSAPIIKKHVHHSRHRSFPHERIPSNGRARVVVHAKIQSLKINRRSKGSKSIGSDHDLHSV
jgi:hypothetical protein